MMACYDCDADSFDTLCVACGLSVAEHSIEHPHGVFKFSAGFHSNPKVLCAALVLPTMDSMHLLLLEMVGKLD